MFTIPCVLVLATVSAPPEKPVKWEYAELSYRNIPAQPAGADADGKPVEAVPASVSIRWTTGGEESQLKGWGELADKVKAAVKKDATQSAQRLQALSALGADGWEIISSQPGSVSVSVRGRDDRGGRDDRNARPFAATTSASNGTTILFKRQSR